jgi:hypothetical protein
MKNIVRYLCLLCVFIYFVRVPYGSNVLHQVLVYLTEALGEYPRRNFIAACVR